MAEALHDVQDAAAGRARAVNDSQADAVTRSSATRNRYVVVQSAAACGLSVRPTVVNMTCDI